MSYGEMIGGFEIGICRQLDIGEDRLEAFDKRLRKNS